MLDQGSEDCDTCAVGGVAAGAVVSSGVWGRTMVRNSRTQEVKQTKRAVAVLQTFTDIGIARSQHLEHRMGMARWRSCSSNVPLQYRRPKTL